MEPVQAMKPPVAFAGVCVSQLWRDAQSRGRGGRRHSNRRSAQQHQTLWQRHRRAPDRPRATPDEPSAPAAPRPPAPAMPCVPAAAPPAQRAHPLSRLYYEWYPLHVGRINRISTNFWISLEWRWSLSGKVGKVRLGFQGFIEILHFVRTRSGATPCGGGVAVDQLNPLRALRLIEKLHVVLGILVLVASTST